MDNNGNSYDYGNYGSGRGSSGQVPANQEKSDSSASTPYSYGQNSDDRYSRDFSRNNIQGQDPSATGKASITLITTLMPAADPTMITAIIILPKAVTTAAIIIMRQAGMKTGVIIMVEEEKPVRITCRWQTGSSPCS